MWDGEYVDKGFSVFCRTGLMWLCVKETLVHQFQELCIQAVPRLASANLHADYVHRPDTHHATWVWGHLRKMLLPEGQGQPRLHCLGL